MCSNQMLRLLNAVTALEFNKSSHNLNDNIKKMQTGKDAPGYIILTLQLCRTKHHFDDVINTPIRCKKNSRYIDVFLHLHLFDVI